MPTLKSSIIVCLFISAVYNHKVRVDIYYIMFQGGPNWVGNFVDAPIIVDEQQKLFYKNPMWYALGHISRFAPATSIKIGLEVENMPKKMSAVALQRPDGGIAVVVLNR